MNRSAELTSSGSVQKPPGDIPLWALYPLFFVAVYISHLSLLRLPYFWDEGGYYIPSALDFFRTGTLIPQTTLSNAHPPLPSILLASWWHLSGFVVSGTRTLVCMVSAAALLAVFRCSRILAGTLVAVATTILTASYSVWYAQSTLAHADIFAAAGTLWALSFYFEARYAQAGSRQNVRTKVWAAVMFSLAALAKETAIITPLALAVLESTFALRQRTKAGHLKHLQWTVILVLPVFPLMAWFGYHRWRTGFVFGNPEYLRYNATANLDSYRVLLSLWHRLLHLTVHMNLFVPVLLAVGCLFLPIMSAGNRSRLPREALQAVAVLLLANLFAFSVLGGALLTRYLLPLYPFVLLLCVLEWRHHVEHWWVLAGLSTVALLTGIWVNPPYAFAPEDNLTYRDMIVLHQQAVSFVDHHYPNATVLTAWPAAAELERPELGYVTRPIRTVPIPNFSEQELTKAAQHPGFYDTALLFSTKWEPPVGSVNLGTQNRSADTRYFDFHVDVRPEMAAVLLHGQVVWQARRRGEWVAVLRFPRVEDAALQSISSVRSSILSK